MKRRYNSEESKRKILSACVKLFIEKGYHNTTLAQVLKEAEVSSSTFQNIFHSKDGVLLELTDFMFDNQFTAARGAASNLKPLYIYALETAIQLTLAELNENLRDIYVEAYSVERVTERIYERTSTELYRIFGSYMPECTESDFYEYEIGTAGVMRNYMAKRCNKYFSLEKKTGAFSEYKPWYLSCAGGRTQGSHRFCAVNQCTRRGKRYYAAAVSVACHAFRV